MSNPYWKGSESQHREAPQKRQERELTERLKLLEFRKADIYRQKDTLDLVRAQLPKVLRTELPVEELHLLYQLSQEEIKELKTSLLISENSNAEFAQQLKTLQQRNLRLDLICRKLNFSLAEKDTLIAKYLSKMVELRTKFEELSNKAEIAEIPGSV